MEITDLFEQSIDHPVHLIFMSMLGLDPQKVVTDEDSADMGLFTIEDKGIDYNVRRDDPLVNTIRLNSLNVYEKASHIDELGFLIPQGIQFGMDKDRAIDVLGKPDKNNVFSNACVWDREHYKLKMRFDDDRLTVIFYTANGR
jgi:hypothetical protein